MLARRAAATDLRRIPSRFALEVCRRWRADHRDAVLALREGQPGHPEDFPAERLRTAIENALLNATKYRLASGPSAHAYIGPKWISIRNPVADAGRARDALMGPERTDGKAAFADLQQEGVKVEFLIDGGSLDVRLHYCPVHTKKLANDA